MSSRYPAPTTAVARREIPMKIEDLKPGTVIRRRGQYMVGTVTHVTRPVVCANVKHILTESGPFFDEGDVLGGRVEVLTGAEAEAYRRHYLGRLLSSLAARRDELLAKAADLALAIAAAEAARHGAPLPAELWSLHEGSIQSFYTSPAEEPNR